MEALRPPTPVATVGQPRDKNSVLEEQRAAAEAVQQCNREIGALEGSIRSVEARLAEDKRAAELETELRVAYRREALSLATATAFETAEQDEFYIAGRFTIARKEKVAARALQAWKAFTPS